MCAPPGEDQAFCALSGCPPSFPYRGAGGGAGGGSSGPDKLLPRGRTRLGAPAPALQSLFFLLLFIIPAVIALALLLFLRPSPAVPARPRPSRRRRRAPDPPPPPLPGPGAQVGLGHPAPPLRSSPGASGPGKGSARDGSCDGKGEARVVRGAGHNGLGCSGGMLPALSCSLHLGAAPGPCATASSGQSSGAVVPHKILTRFLRVVWSNLALCWVGSIPVNSDGSSGG